MITKCKKVFFYINKFLDNKKQLEIHNRVKQLYARKLHKGVIENTRESKVKLSNHRAQNVNAIQHQFNKGTGIYASEKDHEKKNKGSKSNYNINLQKNYEYVFFKLCLKKLGSRI